MPDQAAAEHQSTETTVSKPKKKKPARRVAAKPAQEIADLGKVKLEDLEPGSAQYQTKKKILAEEAKRKKLSVVDDQWIEYHHTNASPKGGKCLHKKRLKNGNVHSFYLGRLHKGGLGAIQAFVQKGVRVETGIEHLKKLIPALAKQRIQYVTED